MCPQIQCQPVASLGGNSKPIVINAVPTDDNKRTPTDDTPNEPIGAEIFSRPALRWPLFSHRAKQPGHRPTPLNESAMTAGTAGANDLVLFYKMGSTKFFWNKENAFDFFAQFTNSPAGLTMWDLMTNNAYATKTNVTAQQAQTFATQQLETNHLSSESTYFAGTCPLVR